MPYKPFNMGNAMAQGEQILNARYGRDPNSLPNQLIAAKIRNEGTKGRFGGIDPTSEMKNFAFRKKIIQDLKAQGASEKEIIQALARFDDSVSKGWYGNIGNVPSYVQAGGEPKPLGTLEGEMRGEASVRGAGAYATEEQKQRAQAGLPYTAPVQAGELQLGTTTGQPVTAAALAGQKVKAQEQAKIEAERESPDFQNKQAIRESDSANAISLIDEMLTLRDDGKIYASYAYGKENVLTPEDAKPQRWIDAEAKRDQLVSMLQLENVQKLKGTGPITEPEQQVLKAAMTVLQNPRISVELVERELRRVRAMFSEWERQAREAQGKAASPGSNAGGMSDEEYNERKKRLLGG